MSAQQGMSHPAPSARARALIRDAFDLIVVTRLTCPPTVHPPLATSLPRYRVPPSSSSVAGKR
jgi:hypothetical protein